MGSPVVIKVAMSIGHNGFYDLLFSCWIKLGIGGADGMEIMTQDGDAPGGYIPPWLSGLSSCSSMVVIKGSRVYAIVCCLFRAVPLMRFGTLVDVMDVTAAEDSLIPMTALSHLGGGQSDWLPQVSQWAGIGALPIRVHWRTVTFFGKDRNLVRCRLQCADTSLLECSGGVCQPRLRRRIRVENSSRCPRPACPAAGDGCDKSVART